MHHAADPPTPWVWAPDADRVEIETANGRYDLARQTTEGLWRADVGGFTHGDDYAYRINGGPPRPDPRSRWQPEGVHAPSRLYDHARFTWTDDGWRGVALPGSLLYELHVGTVTPEGPVDAAIGRPGHPRALGGA